MIEPSHGPVAGQSLLLRFGLSRLRTAHHAGSTDQPIRRPIVRILTSLMLVAMTTTACAGGALTPRDCTNHLVPSHFDSLEGMYQDGKAIHKDVKKNKGLLIANCTIADKPARFDVKKPENGDGFFFRLKIPL